MLFWRQYYWLLLTCSEHCVSEESETQTNASKIIKLDVGHNNDGLSLDFDHNRRRLGENELVYVYNIYMYIYSRSRLTDPIPKGTPARVCVVFASELVSTTSEVEKGWLSTGRQNFSNPHYCKLRDRLNRMHACIQLHRIIFECTPHCIITIMSMM